MTVWKSEITEEMVSSLSGQEVSLLVEALDQAVQEICENWEMKEDSDISWWHCGRAGYWEGDDVYCSKCQTKMQEVTA